MHLIYYTTYVELYIVVIYIGTYIFFNFTLEVILIDGFGRKMGQ